MAYITQQGFRDILRQAPPGSNPGDIARELSKRGHTLEGLDAYGGPTPQQSQEQQQKKEVAARPFYQKAIDTVIPGAQFREKENESDTFFGDISEGVKGGAKQIGSDLLGAAALGETIARTPERLLKYGTISPTKAQEMGAEATAGEQFKEQFSETFTPTNEAQKVGGTIASIGEWFVPATMATKATKAVGAVSKGSQAVKAAKALAAGFAAETAAGSALASSKRGEGTVSLGDVAEGALSAAIPVAFAGAGKGIKAIKNARNPLGAIDEVLKETIDKALRPSLKSQKTPGYYEKAKEALRVIKKYKEPFEEGGVARNPETIQEMVQSIKGAKKKIYDGYTQLANEAGEMGAQYDPTGTMSSIANWVKESGYSKGVKDYASKRLHELGELMDASPAQIQQRIEELNSGLTLFPSSSADKIKNQIDASIAHKLRQSLDDLVLNTTGDAGYQSLRNEYSALKTIEDDVARSAAALARKSKSGLLEVTDIFTGGDITAGVFSGNPALVAKGLAGKGVKEYLTWFSSPNRLIKKTFNLLDQEADTVIPRRARTQKALETGRGATSQVNALINLPESALSPREAAAAAREASIRTGRAPRVEVQEDILALPAGRKGGAQGATINLPSKTQTRREAEEIARIAKKKR